MKTGIWLLLLILIVPSINMAEQNNFEEPLAAYLSDSLWHFVDYKGKDLFPPIKLNNVLGYSEGMYCVSVKKDGKEKWGFLNSFGKFAIEPKYDKAMLFSEDFAMVYEFSPSQGTTISISVLDKNGKVINSEELIDALPFSEGCAYANTRTGKSGYINSLGDFVINLKELVGAKFSEGLAVVTNYDMNAGYINKKGELVIPVQFESAGGFSEGFAPVNKNSKYSYINKLGEIKIDGKYDFAHNFKEGRAFVGDLYPKSFKTYWGLIDTSGKMLKDYSFLFAWDFSEGVAAVQDSLHWGFIDKSANYKINPVYSYAASFVKSIAWASKKDEGIFGYINKQGEYILKFDKFEKLIDLRLNKRMY